jgi:hypothetical protein
MLYPAQPLPQHTLRKQKIPLNKKPAEVGLSKRAEEMLHAIHQLRSMTAWDMTRLFYTPT